jgi:SAM-dependent methyltransferase
MSNPPSPVDMWDERYGSADYAFGTEPNTFLRDNIDALPSGEVLCVADGEGRNSVFVAASGRAVSSVDLSPAGVEKARRLAAERNVTINAMVGDLADFSLGDARWDAIISIFAHMPSALRSDLHQRVVRALRPGGIFLLEAYTPDQIPRGTGGPAIPDRTMTLNGLRDELAPLEFLHGVEREREVVEGAYHTGLASVVQVIARKAP